MNVGNSASVRLFRTIEEKLQTAQRNSRVIGFGREFIASVEAIVRGSYCYRWLTKEPDPDIVVIDLRETRTVGPMLALLEAAISPVERMISSRQFNSVSSPLNEAVANSRTSQLATALLEPPESGRSDDDNEKK